MSPAPVRWPVGGPSGRRPQGVEVPAPCGSRHTLILCVSALAMAFRDWTKCAGPRRRRTPNPCPSYRGSGGETAKCDRENPGSGPPLLFERCIVSDSHRANCPLALIPVLSSQVPRPSMLTRPGFVLSAQSTDREMCRDAMPEMLDFLEYWPYSTVEKMGGERAPSTRHQGQDRTPNRRPAAATRRTHPPGLR